MGPHKREDARQIRAMVLGGVCPWCGLSGLLSPAKHTNAKHGIGRKELRERMGLVWTSSICAPELSEWRQQFNARPKRRERLSQMGKERKGKTFDGSRQSPAGRQMSVDNAHSITFRPGRYWKRKGARV